MGVDAGWREAARLVFSHATRWTLTVLGDWETHSGNGCGRPALRSTALGHCGLFSIARANELPACVGFQRG